MYIIYSTCLFFVCFPSTTLSLSLSPLNITAFIDRTTIRTMTKRRRRRRRTRTEVQSQSAEEVNCDRLLRAALAVTSSMRRLQSLRFRPHRCRCRCTRPPQRQEQHCPTPKPHRCDRERWHATPLRLQCGRHSRSTLSSLRRSSFAPSAHFGVRRQHQH